MATSGSYDFTVTRDNIIKATLTKLKVIDHDGTPTTAQVNSLSVVLNAMVKAWRSDGVFLWSLEETVQALTASTIVVGTDGNDYECIKAHTSAAANKPITGANYLDYWKATGDTGDGVAWVTATAYVCIAENSLAAEIIGIDRAFYRSSEYVDTPLRPITREEYMAIGNKTTKATPTMVWFSRELGQSKMVLSPIPPDGATGRVHYDAIKKSQDFDAAGDNPDFTEEWFEALYLGLADKVSLSFNLPRGERMDLKNEAMMAKNLAMMGDNENTSLQISPER